MIGLHCLSRTVALAAVLATMASAVIAADTSGGRQKAQPCTVCHGALGLSSAPDAPNLAGQPELYLATQLRAYRSGKREDKVMSIMAKSLSDDDIRELSAWYASLVIEVKAPP